MVSPHCLFLVDHVKAEMQVQIFKEAIKLLTEAGMEQQPKCSPIHMGPQSTSKKNQVTASQCANCSVLEEAK